MKIGIIAPLSSRYNYFGVPVANGLTLGLEEAIADGQVLSIEMRDNASDEEITRQRIDELDRLGVIAILGPVESHMAAVGAEEARLRSLPVITPSGTASYITREPNPWFFRAISSDKDRTDALARWAMRDLDGDPIMVIHEVNTEAQAAAGSPPLYGESAGADFLDVIRAADYPHTTITFHRDNATSRELKLEATRQLAEDGVEAAAIFAPMTHLIDIGEYLRDQRRDLPIYTISPGRDLFRRSAIRDGVKAVTDTIIEDTDAVELIEFREKYQERFPDEPDDPVAQYATFGYDAARILTAALRRLPADSHRAELAQQRDTLREQILLSPARVDLLMSTGNFVGNNDLMFKPSRRVLRNGVWEAVSREDVVRRVGAPHADVPVPPEELEQQLYDAFVSYRHLEPDSAFAWDLWKKLRDRGYRVAIDENDFRSALTFLEELERCVRDSRFTLAVISPRYFESGNTMEEAIIKQIMDMGDRERTLIPLITEEVANMPAWLYARVGVSFIRDNPHVDPFEKLLRDLGEPQPDE